MNRTSLARGISILGHPALVMPAAIALAATQHDAAAEVRRLALGLALVIAAVVTAYSVAQVRAGRWAHVDASVPQERTQLNLVLALLLGAATALLWARGGQPEVVAGLGASTVMVMVALATRRVLKLSLHCAFGAFAAMLLWPLPVSTLLFAGLAAAVAWSRLHLRRHTRSEVAVGLCLGTATGGLLPLLAG